MHSGFKAKHKFSYQSISLSFICYFIFKTKKLCRAKWEPVFRAITSNLGTTDKQHEMRPQIDTFGNTWTHHLTRSGWRQQSGLNAKQASAKAAATAEQQEDLFYALHIVVQWGEAFLIPPKIKLCRHLFFLPFPSPSWGSHSLPIDFCQCHAACYWRQLQQDITYGVEFTTSLLFQLPQSSSGG